MHLEQTPGSYAQATPRTTMVFWIQCFWILPYPSLVSPTSFSLGPSFLFIIFYL